VELIALHDNQPIDDGKRRKESEKKEDGESDGEESDERKDKTKDEDGLPEAYLLIVRQAIPYHEVMMHELMELEWDKKALMRGKVVNKHARFNLCFDDMSQEPNYEEGSGRIIAYDQVPLLKQMKEEIIERYVDRGDSLKVEGNLYYDVNRCGIGFHGDSERRKVIGLRLGASFPMVFHWYQRSERVGEAIEIHLQSGDLYMMSEKATGFDWKKKLMYTIRHAAGCAKYTK
jgi:hypothetical protein